MKLVLSIFLFLVLSTAMAAECTTSAITGPDGRTIICITCCTEGKYCSTSCS